MFYTQLVVIFFLQLLFVFQSQAEAQISTEEPSIKQRAEYKEIFHIFDKNKSGQITTVELGTTMNALGLSPTETELQDMINDVDLNGDGIVDFEDFLAMMFHKPSEETQRDEISEIFKIFKPDKNGFIGKTEIQRVMAQLGETFTDSEMEEMMRQVDKDKDGKVSQEDFYKMLCPD